MIRLIDTRYGKMLVRDDDKYVGKYLIEYGEFGWDETESFRNIVKPGMVVLDVGANIGVHTLLFSKLVGNGGRVFAYEPQPDMFYMLCGNLALNDIQNVVALNKGCGESYSTVGVPRMRLHGEVNNYGSFSLVEKYDHCTDLVEIIPIEQDCDFMKIDVEEYESRVLRGAAKMIERCRPWIHVENDRSYNADEVIETVRSLGYTPYWTPTLLFNPDNFNGNKVNKFLDLCSIDMLCAPPGCTVTGGKEAVKGNWVEVYPPTVRQETVWHEQRAA